MNASPSIRQTWLRRVALPAFWLLLTLAFAAQLVFTGSFTWEQAVRLAARDWLPWALVSPFVVWLAGRFPLERRKWMLSVPVHALGCAAAIAACEVLANSIGPPRPQGFGPPRRGPPFADTNAPPFQREGPLRRGPPTERGFGPPGGMFGRGRGPGPGAWMWGRLHLPVYWVIVSVVHALSYYRRSQERERKAAELTASLAEAKLHALKLQLHPHFLFNALNAIATLVHKDPHAADDMIANLSELLRLALDSADVQEVPLRQELEFLDRYLEIEHVRLGERLRVEKDVAAATLDAAVPTMILQPLVENAIRHGIEPRKSAGIVTIRATREGELLHLSVCDNGVGLGAANQQRERTGIGLANTRARLAELYGERARLQLSGGDEGGLAVDVQLPFHTAPAASEAKPSAIEV
ncbi:MAG: histidine kinase [Verrucomicrobia bacterium]|nr:histidine kinase [Verrucomicrobiota bacterium]